MSSGASPWNRSWLGDFSARGRTWRMLGTMRSWSRGTLNDPLEGHGCNHSSACFVLGGIPDWNYDNYGGFIGTLEYELTINGFIGTFYWDIYKWLRYIGTLEYDYIKTINGFSGHWAWTNILFLFIKVWVSKSDPTVGWSCGPVLQQNKFDLPETTVSTGAKMKGSDWLTYWSWQCYNNPERDNEVHGIAITLLWQICVHFCACEY